MKSDSPPGLSLRLSRVLQHLGPGPSLADIGSDHALLPLAWLRLQPAGQAIAIDRAPAPLEGAARHRAQSAVGERLILRRGDGLLALHDQCPHLVSICGLSGRGILGILQRDPHGRREAIQRFVLAPNDRDYYLRAALPKLGLQLVDEDALWERERYFPILIACPQKAARPTEISPASPPNATLAQALGSSTPSATEMAQTPAPKLAQALAQRFGPFLLARRDTSLRRYLIAQQKRLLDIRSQQPREFGPLFDELRLVQAALALYEKSPFPPGATS